MFKFLGNAVAGLFLDKEARKAVGETVKARKRPAAPADAREQALEQVKAQARLVMTPERAELIRKAMDVARSKRHILDSLDDATRQRLVVEAMRRLLNEDVPDPPKKDQK